MHPEKGVAAPAPAIGAVESAAALPIEADHGTTDVALQAMLIAAARIAVAQERHLIAFYAIDAMEHEEALGDFREYT